MELRSQPAKTRVRQRKIKSCTQTSPISTRQGLSPMMFTLCVLSPRWLRGEFILRAHTHIHTHITYRHNVFAFVSVFFFLFFLSGWMCPQVRVIFPSAQIRAELKSEAKVTALPPEILRQTPPPQPYCAEVKEYSNSAHKRRCRCASFVKSPSFLVFSLFLCQNSRSFKAQWHQLSFPFVFFPVCAQV